VSERPGAFDLQAHSTCSDGELAPAAVVAAAAGAGIRLLAQTDLGLTPNFGSIA
jgi:hypothetical protein